MALRSGQTHCTIDRSTSQCSSCRHGQRLSANRSGPARPGAYVCRAHPAQRGAGWIARGQHLARQHRCAGAQRLCGIPPARRCQPGRHLCPPGAPEHPPQRHHRCRIAAGQPTGQHARARHRGGRDGAQWPQAWPGRSGCGQPRQQHRRARMAAQQIQHQRARGRDDRHRQLVPACGQGRRGGHRRAHGARLRNRYPRLRRVAGPFWHEGRGAPWQGPTPGAGRMGRVTAGAGLPQPERPAEREHRVRPVPEGRPRAGQAAGCAEPASPAPAAGAGLPRCVQPGFRI